MASSRVREDLTPIQRDILSHLDPVEPKTIYDVCEITGASYWQLYPNFQALIKHGLIQAGIYTSDKRKTYTKTDSSKTPKIHLRGPDNPRMSIWDIAKAAPQMTDDNQPIIGLLQDFPHLLLNLYEIAARSDAGYGYEPKTFAEQRNRLMALRSNLRNYLMGLEELLNHPAFSGDPKELTRCLMHDESNIISYNDILAVRNNA